MVEVQGQNFVDTVTGNRFQILGVDYQPGGSAGFGPGFGDPLSNPPACLRDAALMQRLGVSGSSLLSSRTSVQTPLSFCHFVVTSLTNAV